VRTPEEKEIDRRVSAAQRIVSQAERRRGAILMSPKDARGYRAWASWLELEAKRRYPSWRETLEYAKNQRWMAEMVNLHGLEKAQEIGRKHFRMYYRAQTSLRYAAA
jgi:hypothetical protein